jgi:hypothetical protein
LPLGTIGGDIGRMQWLWKWGGKSFGYREGDEL